MSRYVFYCNSVLVGSPPMSRLTRSTEMQNQNGNNNGNNGNQYNYYNQGNNNAQQYYGNYFVGPYCSPKDHKSIHLGVFYDEACSAMADVSVYGQKNYGATLPFSKTSMVSSGCISCLDEQNNNNGNNNNGNNQNNGNNGNNQYYYGNPKEMCTQMYEGAARCEKGMDLQYPDTTGCEYIHKILPRLESASQAIVYGGNGRAKGFAWLFGITTVVFGAYAYFLYRKIKRGSVSLNQGTLA